MPEACQGTYSVPADSSAWAVAQSNDAASAARKIFIWNPPSKSFGRVSSGPHGPGRHFLRLQHQLRGQQAHLRVLRDVGPLDDVTHELRAEWQRHLVAVDVARR